MIEVTIDSIRMSMISSQRVVILREKNAGRYLPIWIGPSEADAIAVRLQNMSVPRPLTHDLLSTVISSLGATVAFIVVNELKDDTFYAKIVLNVNGGQLEIDSRPSDAIALAVRTKAPLFVEESVLDRAGIFLDQETTPARSAESDGKPPTGETKSKPDEQEIKRMSAFKDFIDSLNLEDFDRRKS
ncbi:MAG: bifunctional nuclease family protein [Dehalococcoidia bacterium]|nr:bifunctional nuclease family protein [Dehalococcoidia bacterium]